MTPTRGEVLSRVTNDIDNIASTLQQSMTQLIGRRDGNGIHGHDGEHQSHTGPADLGTLPLSFIITVGVARRSQKQFAAQWESTGKLNSHIGRCNWPHCGEDVQWPAQGGRAFDEENARLYGAASKARYIWHHHAACSS